MWSYAIHVVREGEKWAWSSFHNCVFLQSAIQDVDYENEVELLYAVVTLPDGDEGTLALLCFVDDKTGDGDKESSSTNLETSEKELQISA